MVASRSEYVEPDGILVIRGIEIHNVIGAIWAECRNQECHRPSRREDRSARIAEATLNVLHDEIADESRFAGASLAIDSKDADDGLPAINQRACWPPHTSR